MQCSMPLTCTMVSICMDHIHANFAHISHEIRIDGKFTCVLACGYKCEFRANFA